MLKAEEQEQAVEAEKQQEVKTELFVEGFIFNGIEGTVSPADTEDGRKWMFTSSSTIEGPEDGLLPAGESLELLESNTLGAMIAGYEDAPMAVKLWAKVTLFRPPVKRVRKSYTGYESRRRITSESSEATNYLFPVYFLPLTDGDDVTEKSGEPGDGSGEEGAEENQPLDEGNSSQEEETASDSILPEEVRKALKPKRIVDLSKAKKAVDIEGDMVLVNRTGRFVRTKGRYFFEVEGVGRNVADRHFELLPCESLAKAIVEMNRPMGGGRWKVSGTVTKFNNDYMLLLSKMTRVYGNGNFR